MAETVASSIDQYPRSWPSWITRELRQINRGIADLDIRKSQLVDLARTIGELKGER